MWKALFLKKSIVPPKSKESARDHSKILRYKSLKVDGEVISKKVLYDGQKNEAFKMNGNFFVVVDESTDKISLYDPVEQVLIPSSEIVIKKEKNEFTLKYNLRIFDKMMYIILNRQDDGIIIEGNSISTITLLNKSENSFYTMFGRIKYCYFDMLTSSEKPNNYTPLLFKGINNKIEQAGIFSFRASKDTIYVNNIAYHVQTKKHDSFFEYVGDESITFPQMTTHRYPL